MRVIYEASATLMQSFLIVERNFVARVVVMRHRHFVVIGQEPLSFMLFRRTSVPRKGFTIIVLLMGHRNEIPD